MTIQTKQLAGLLGIALLAGGAAAQITTLPYVQNFATTTNQVEVGPTIGWNWAASDGGVSNNGARQFGLLSNANGPDGTQGFAFQYSDAAFSSVIWAESNLAKSAIEAFSAQVGHNNVNHQVRFLIRVGDAINNNWYVSTAAGQSPFVQYGSNFQAGAVPFSVNFSTAGANWAALDYDGLLGELSTGFAHTNSFTPLVNPLPAGNITAIGAYFHASATFASVRLDDFTVTAIPEMGSLALGGLALVSLLLFRRRR